MNRKEAEKQLKQLFGFETFHDQQWTTIQHVLKGERVLLIERTGFGKSLCYQFPAAVFPGITLIFSPLIALMRDQVYKLNSLGIASGCINSEQSASENNEIFRKAKEGKIKILYVAPERMDNLIWMQTVKELPLSMVVVYEAHCISVWGHDLRPAFRRIIELVKTLKAVIPVLATTATATKDVERDIAAQLGGSVKVIRGKLMRDNLELQVIEVACQDDKLRWLAQHLKTMKGSGIIYTGTRKEVLRYTTWLKQNGIACTGYHAGLSSAERVKTEKGLMNNEWTCIVSTNALGMGIDKPDLRFIIHTQIPQSPIHYYQEIGRAGRDGAAGKVILLYHPSDTKLPLMFINFSKPPSESYLTVICLLVEKDRSEQELCNSAMLSDAAWRSIKSDLMEQGILIEKVSGNKKYLHFVREAPPINFSMVDTLREIRLAELDQMVAYAETKESRMKFLCTYLGDEEDNLFKNCDNSGIKPLLLKPDSRLEMQLRKFNGETEDAMNTPAGTKFSRVHSRDIEKIKNKKINVHEENPFG